MVKNTIKVFARLKPELDKILTVNYKIHKRPEKHPDEDFLVIRTSKKFAEYIDNRPESWNFSFRQIFDQTIKQEDIFNDVALPVITSLFDGYNGTIFAYGQTGSGKTYTITGDSKNFDDYSGILPRTIHHVFELINNNTSSNLYTVELSYLEIYNENGYDLLDQEQRNVALRLEDLPRVEIHEDELGIMHLKNLGIHPVNNENEAMNLLFIGDKNRITSETPMNPHSSRSHCIFTIILSSKKYNSNYYNRTKMHLVDLAGSERVYKCAITGTILTEAKYINLSLHYLEQVIVCLGQENMSHVPYRNSLLTAILRDSLGGNCITNMLANLSISAFNLEETISTCRFSQRVALIRNDVKLILRKEMKTEWDLLKIENEQLRMSIDRLNRQLESQILTDKSIEYYKELVSQRDIEISSLIEKFNVEKVNHLKITEDKMIETNKPKLSKINENFLIDIFPDYQKNDKKIYSKGKLMNNDNYPVHTLYHDINFDTTSLDESQNNIIEMRENLLNNKLTLELNYDKCICSKKNLNINDIPIITNSQKVKSANPKMTFRTRKIIRQLFGLEKKSPRPLSLPDTPKHAYISSINNDNNDKLPRNNDINFINTEKCIDDNTIKVEKNFIDDITVKNQNINEFIKNWCIEIINKIVDDKTKMINIKNLLTGNMIIDKDIIEFYKAKYYDRL